jgi:hypothetical protein
MELAKNFLTQEDEEPTALATVSYATVFDPLRLVSQSTSAPKALRVVEFNATALIGFLLTNFDSTFQILSCTNVNMKDEVQQPIELKPLSIALERLVKRLRNEIEEHQDEQQHPEPDYSEAEQEVRAEFQRRYVEQRLRELQIWERRINGEKRPNGK